MEFKGQNAAGYLKHRKLQFICITCKYSSTYAHCGDKVYTSFNIITGHVSYKTTMFWMVKNEDAYYKAPFAPGIQSLLWKQV